MRRVFLSDVHLEHVDDPRAQRFAECLHTESRRVDELYLLGDIVEMWVGDDDDDEVATFLHTALADAAAHCRVAFMHGNRDFLMGQAAAARDGFELLEDPWVTSDGLLLSHGDRYCIDDERYQAARALFRSEAWQADILARSLAERKALGTALRAQSRQENANKATNIMDTNAGALSEALASTGAHTIVHGHTHRPGLYANRVVLGAWERCGWMLRQNDAQLSLECFTLARRYEI